LNLTGNCLCRSIRDIVDARAGTWHKYVYIPHERLSFAFAVHLCTCAGTRAHLSSFWGRLLGKLTCARAHILSHVYSYRVAHLECYAAAGARRPSSPVPPVCAESFPAKLSVVEQQSSRLAQLLPRTGGAPRSRSDDRYFVSRINKATPCAAAWLSLFLSLSLSLSLPFFLSLSFSIVATLCWLPAFGRKLRIVAFLKRSRRESMLRSMTVTSISVGIE